MNVKELKKSLKKLKTIVIVNLQIITKAERSQKSIILQKVNKQLTRTTTNLRQILQVRAHHLPKTTREKIPLHSESKFPPKK